ncbi:MAG: MarR family winged helix-turn-helix transcriptional regulator [Eubacteriales bacterium]|nr:MarR family winged helix-turn-helix transcriptional regulator [Eubacteriales bacterium]
MTYDLNENAALHSQKGSTTLGDSFLKVATGFSDLDRNSEIHLGGDSYVNSEMQIVKLIQENPEITTTTIADILGITKGAVSQFTGKLEKKNILTKEKSPENQSRILFRLTEKGVRLYDVHESYPRSLDQVVEEALRGASEENRRFLKKFLDEVEKRILTIHIDE